MVVKTVSVAAVVAAAVGGAVAARGEQSAPATGGLSLGTVGAPKGSSLVVDQKAQAGAARTYQVANRSKSELDVTITARPWRQSTSGAVSVNRRASLGGVGVSESAFTLAPGASKNVTVTLDSVPSAGYLYGGLEVVGVPSDLAERKGIVPGYRLVTALRYNAATPVYGLKGGAASFTGTGSARTLTLTVRNTGNTVAPVSGRVRLKGPLGTKNGSLRATRILPRKSVKVALAKASSLRPGSYTATVTLIQNRKSTKITKQVRVR